MKDNFQVKYRKIPVTTTVKAYGDISHFVFIVDTGASHTIFDKTALYALGYSKKDFIARESLKGFGGQSHKVPFIEIPSIKVLGLIRRNIKVGAMDFSPTMFYDGILGIDFFLNHKLCLDFRQGIIELD